MISSDFLKNSRLIAYAKDKKIDRQLNETDENFKLSNTDQFNVNWLNTYGLDRLDDFKEVIIKEDLDDFLIKLLSDSDHPNKVIELDNAIFVATKILKPNLKDISTEQMFFIVSSSFVWSIQEHKGDYFEDIRDRLLNTKSLIRRKSADYLFFSIIEATIDNYTKNLALYEEYSTNELKDAENFSTPKYTKLVEVQKRYLIDFKRASNSLRDLTIKLEKTELENFEGKYFSELKEQANNLIADIDFLLEILESKLNLAFSTQSDRLNKVMQTLTSYSVIFTPITFIAGIYGMNFKIMPELEAPNGYFIVWGIMIVISAINILFFVRRKWF